MLGGPKAAQRASHELEATTKQYVLASLRSIGFDRIEGVEPVSMLEDLALTNRSPSSFVLGFSLPCRLCSSEYLLVNSRPMFAFRRGHHLPRFPPSSQHHNEASTEREGSQSLTTFRPQVFATSRRFTPLQSLQAYFILQPRTRFARSGDSLSAQYGFLIGSRCPLVVQAMDR